MLPVAGSDRFTRNCPNCGAPVKFRFAQAVQTVCEFCRSILVRRDVDLVSVGRTAAVADDSSPIQIGTEGVFQKQPFVVVGRITYLSEYAGNRWNEWHLAFTNGSSGWLSDSVLEYAVSFRVQPDQAIPGSLMREQTYTHAGIQYVTTSVTRASYLSVEGDLPFEYWDKESALYADLRTYADRRFATVDYSENPPLLFVGWAVDYEELQLKNLCNFEGWQ
jgi:hypothetical protein